MLIVLPTYKRLNEFYWSLYSLFQCDTDFGEQARLCVVCNHPESADSVTQIVEKCRQTVTSSEGWDIEILIRERTLDPITNWYSAIFEKASINEIVGIHGDDDIMLPWGLADRVKWVKGNGVDCILSTFLSGLLFSEKNKVKFEKRSFHREPLYSEIDYSSRFLGNSPFIGNSLYRNTESFKNAFELCMDWAKGQKWVPIETATLMIPFYLPIAILTVGGKVAGGPQACTIRGTNLQEIISSPFGTRSWNSNFLIGLAYEILSSNELKDLKDLEHLRASYLDLVHKNWPLVLFDKRINSEQKKCYKRRCIKEIKLRNLMNLRSFLSLLIELLNLRRFTIKSRLKNCEEYDIKSFLDGRLYE